MEAFDTPDGSHPIYYAAAHAYEAAVRAAIAAKFAADHGDLSEKAREEWAERMLEYHTCFDQAWIHLRLARLTDLDLPAEEARNELEFIEEQTEILDIEDRRDWSEIINQAQDAEATDYAIREFPPKSQDES